MPDRSRKGRRSRSDLPVLRSAAHRRSGERRRARKREAAHARAGVDLKDAQQVLEQETARIHERYDQIVQTEKGRGAALDKLFKSHIEKSKDEPAPRPIRDIDLD